MRGPIFFFSYQNPVPAKDRGDRIYLPVNFRYQGFIFHGTSVNSQQAAGSRRLGLIMMESSAIPMPRWIAICFFSPPREGGSRPLFVVWMRLKILREKKKITATGEYVRNREVRSMFCFRKAPGILMKSCGYWSGKGKGIDDKVIKPVVDTRTSLVTRELPNYSLGKSLFIYFSRRRLCFWYSKFKYQPCPRRSLTPRLGSCMPITFCSNDLQLPLPIHCLEWPEKKEHPQHT